MPFDFAEFLRVAEALVEGAADQAKLRCATSRLYYGVRGYAETIARASGVKGMLRNNDLIGYWVNRDPALGGKLKDLWDARVQADYFGNVDPLSLRAFQANLSLARQVEREFKALLPPRR